MKVTLTIRGTVELDADEVETILHKLPFDAEVSVCVMAGPGHCIGLPATVRKRRLIIDQHAGGALDHTKIRIELDEDQP